MPKSVRSMVGSGDDFSYRVHYRFHRDAFDEAHPFRYTTEFPVLSEPRGRLMPHKLQETEHV